MYFLISYLKEYMKDMKNKIAYIESFLDKAPKGYLKVSHKKNGIPEYCYCKINPNKGNVLEKTYLKKKQENTMNLIQLLAQKSYYKKMLPLLEKEVSLLQKLLVDNDIEAKYLLHKRSAKGRRELIKPLYESVEDKILAWEAEEYKKSTNYPEYLKYETNQGEMVRSKSEVIIANILKESGICLYRYEAALHLANKDITVYPDFTIISLITGRIIYWEHFGMMDNVDYRNKCLRKINLYTVEGLRPGIDIIYTFESELQPLNITSVRKLVKELFCIDTIQVVDYNSAMDIACE